MPFNLNHGSNVGIDSSGNASLFLDSPVNYITITSEFPGLLFSVDKGQTFISVPVGTHSFKVGITNKIMVQSNQSWQIIAEKV